MALASAARRLHGDERGAGLVLALLAVIIVAGLAVVFVATTTVQLRASGDARDREEALHVAESGAELVLGQLAGDVEYATGPELDPSAEPDEADWARDAADEVAATGGVTLLEEGDRHAVGIRPLGPDGAALDRVYGVGAVGSGAEATVRVVRYDIDWPPEPLDVAILAEHDIELHHGGAGVSMDIQGAAGSVHSNDDLYLLPGQDNPGSIEVEGDATASGDYTTDGDVTVHGDAGGGRPEVDIPSIAAEDFYDEHREAEGAYDLCPDGLVREPTPDGPCDPTASTHPSSAVHQDLAWGGPAVGWQWVPTGVVEEADVSLYVHRTNMAITAAAGAFGQLPNVLSLSILVSGDPEAETAAELAASGHLDLTVSAGRLQVERHLAAALFVADRDVALSSASKMILGREDRQGLVAAGGAIDIPSSGEGAQMFGAFVAQDPEAPFTRFVGSGDMHITYDGGLAAPAGDVVRVTGWQEL